jgi:hypothetical protein
LQEVFPRRFPPEVPVQLFLPMAISMDGTERYGNSWITDFTGLFIS